MSTTTIIKDFIELFDNAIGAAVTDDHMSSAMEVRALLQKLCDTMGTDVPRILVDHATEEQIRATANERAKLTHSQACGAEDLLDMDFDDLAETESKNKKTLRARIQLPLCIKLQEKPVNLGRVPKASLAYKMGDGDDKEWYALLRVDDAYYGSWEIVYNSTIEDRINEGVPIHRNTRALRSITDAKNCGFVVLWKELAAIATGTSTADVVRANADKQMTPLPVADDDGKISYFKAKVVMVDDPVTGKPKSHRKIERGEQVKISLDKIVLNPDVLEHIRNGDAVESVFTEPHNACRNPFLHRIDSRHTYFFVDGKYARAIDMVHNAAFENLRTCKFAAGRLNRSEKFNKDPKCMFVVLKEGAQLYDHPSKGDENTMTLDQYENTKGKKSNPVDDAHKDLTKDE